MKMQWFKTRSGRALLVGVVAIASTLSVRSMLTAFADENEPTQRQTLSTPGFSWPSSAESTHFSTEYREGLDANGNRINYPVQVVQGAPSELRPATRIYSQSFNSLQPSLATQIRQAPDDATKVQLTNELKKQLETEFDEMHERQGQQITEMKTRFEKAESVYKLRSENRDRIVQRRMEELLGPPAELQWNAPPNDSMQLIDPRQPRYSQPPVNTQPATNGAWFNPNPSNVTTTLRFDSPGSFARSATNRSTESIDARIFSVNRELASLKLELESAEIKAKEINGLLEKGALPKSETMKATSNVTRLQTLIRIQEQERVWLVESVQRTVQRAAQKLQEAREKAGNRELDAKDRRSAESEMRQAESELEEAKKLKELTDSFDSQPPSNDPQPLPSLRSPSP